MRQFNQDAIWTSQQLKVIESEPNLIVSGCAGSGKTLIACKLAILHAQDKKVAILVFTKSLRTFINDYIKELTDKDVTVLYEFQWAHQSFTNFDLIIIDEFQDFSINDIKAFISNSKIGVYLFGDTEQSLYKKNLKDEKTVNLQGLIEVTNFKHVKLETNYRIPEINKKFITSLFTDKEMSKQIFIDGSKPKVIRFDNHIDELNWIKGFLENNIVYKNIGILLKQNDGYKGAYYEKKRIRKDYIYGILELHDFFLKNGIKTFYKYHSEDNLSFTNDYNINIMTYHSSKGLQFGCVILPFTNFVNENNGADNLPYVGLTRSSDQIIITYTGLIAEEYSKKVLNTLYEGIILSQNEYDVVSIVDISEARLLLENRMKSTLLEFLKKGIISDHEKQRIIDRITNSEQIVNDFDAFNSTDCKIKKF